MKRRTVAAALMLLTTTAFVLAGKQGSVVTVGGDRITGDITETRETITIVRKGVTTVFPRDEIVNIDYSTYAERFEIALKALAADDVDGRLTLAREAFDQREYVLAQRAVDEAININPLSRAAMELSHSITSQITLDAQKKKPASAPTPASPSTTDPATTAPNREFTPDKRHFRGMNPDQINIVRQKELQTGDNVRVQFRNNVKKAFVDAQPGMTFRDFSTLTDTAQALQILQRGTDDQKRDVMILSDPTSIQSFGRRLQTAVLQGCATSQCHGGNAAGNFKLLSGTPDGSTLVTNFYLLMQYRQRNKNVDGSVFAPDESQMVDRGHARESLLYQFALPRARATVKHPEVRRWDGIVTNETDRLATDIETWMNKELAPVAPQYGFDFSLLPTTQPATEPTTAAAQATEETPTTDPATKSAD